MKPIDFKKRRWIWLAGICAYLLALYLLTLTECKSPDASIRTVSDAFWYSLVTMSTVGYGDLYPVTPLGRLLGLCFILLSLGLLTFLLGLLIQIVTGKLLPSIQLWSVRNQHWYIFSCQNSAAFALAKDLAAENPGCILLFPQCADSTPPEQLPCLTYSGSPEALTARKKDGCSILFLDEEDTYSRAVSALAPGHPVYCRTTYKPDTCPANLTLFDPYDCCAQRYWQDHGLQKEEQIVILIGDGTYAQTLLTRGLLLNVFAPERATVYHIFGNWQDYQRIHHQMVSTLCSAGQHPKEDCLYFHDSAWNEDASLLHSAHRIILCQDNPSENINILGHIHQYFPVTGKIHLLCQSTLPGETVFGTEEDIYTAQLILQAQLSQAARAMHQIYCLASGGNAPAWEHLSEFLRQSNIAAASHLLTKIRLLLEDDTITSITPDNCRKAYDRYCRYTPEQKEICRRIEHQRWMRFHCLYNWRYAPVRSNTDREHPLMVPYEALAPSEQAKDDYAWELLNQLAHRLKG